GRVTNLSPGAALAGHVVVEDLAQIGMNATVNLHVRIGAGCIIGNGATVKADVPAGTRVWAGSTWPLRNS
ncbi:MAG: 2,3,4,5-tetrahydropyridine-2,6-dicarboxylate N-acetyltransferase, partial [Anaerolineae bacterium]|nr:2,3,4,5-tetrahydropyridine-2,6-dicarboxylate N-acetyltransferase [Anaerolineae bacterium]